MLKRDKSVKVNISIENNNNPSTNPSLFILSHDCQGFFNI